MRNQEAAAVEDHDIPAPYCRRLDFLYDDKVPGRKPRAHTAANNSQNDVAAFTDSVVKLLGAETLRAGNYCIGRIGWLAILNSVFYGLAVLRRPGESIYSHLTNLYAVDGLNSLSFSLEALAVISA
jgi:hypothetical protein